MIQNSKRLGLRGESVLGLRVARKFIVQKLQGDEAAQLGVFGFIDDTHASSAQFFDDVIPRDGLTDHSDSTETLLQFCVLGFSLLQDRDVRVGVFPESEEILVSSFRFRVIAGQGVGASQAEMRQRADGLVPHYAWMVENLLKFAAAAGPCLAARYASPRK